MDDWQAGIDEALAGLEDLISDDSNGEDNAGPIKPSEPVASTSQLPKNADKDDVKPLGELDNAPDNERPSYNWWQLIRAAIVEAPGQRLTLNEIYDAVANKYPFFKTDPDTWRNAIRHNLSVKPCFKKDKRDSDSSKLGYWSVDLDIDPSQGRARHKKQSAADKAKRPAAQASPKPTPTEVRTYRAKQAASLMFVRDPISKLPVVDDAVAATFDRALANMVNRSLFKLTEAVLRKALGANFSPLPPTTRPSHTTYYKVDDELAAASADQTNANNKRPLQDNALADPNKRPMIVPNPSLPFHPTPELIQGFAQRINMLINAPIPALVPFPAGAIPAPRFEDDPVPKTLAAINSSIKQQAQPVYTRPKQSFPDMVKQVIQESPNQRLTASEIFDAIESKHPYFSQIADSWKNTVRNVLTVHECFTKRPRDPDVPGRGDFWVCDASVPIWLKKVANSKKANPAASVAPPQGTNAAKAAVASPGAGAASALPPSAAPGSASVK